MLGPCTAGAASKIIWAYVTSLWRMTVVFVVTVVIHRLLLWGDHPAENGAALGRGVLHRVFPLCILSFFSRLYEVVVCHQL